MRPLLAAVLAVAFALVAAGAGASNPTPTVSVGVSPVAPRPKGPTRVPSGRRGYAVTFRVSVTAGEQCANLSVGYSYVALFDGRRSLAGSATNYYETSAPATSAEFDVHAAANAGDVVAFRARGYCEDDNGNDLAVSRVVASRSAVPPHSCEQGPLSVFGTRGAVRREDLTSRASVPVRGGQYLWTGYHVVVGRRSRVAFGARECHAFRVIVDGPATFVPGDYSRGSYGTSLLVGYGSVADFRGDQHSGGVETPNAAALPRGNRTAASRVAHFRIVSLPRRLGRVTRVEVSSGQIFVAARLARRRGVAYGTPIVVRRGEGAVVRCESSRSCEPSLTRR